MDGGWQDLHKKPNTHCRIGEGGEERIIPATQTKPFTKKRLKHLWRLYGEKNKNTKKEGEEWDALPLTQKKFFSLPFSPHTIVYHLIHK